MGKKSGTISDSYQTVEVRNKFNSGTVAYFGLKRSFIFVKICILYVNYSLSATSINRVPKQIAFFKNGKTCFVLFYHYFC